MSLLSRWRQRRSNIAKDPPTEEEILKSRKDLWDKKEKVYVDKPWQGYCDNDDHPLFSIKVSIDKPVSVCYYCSKVWILNKESKG